MHVTGKTIVITGASRGLGRVLALRLARHQPRLVLVGRDQVALQATATEIARHGGTAPLTITCDVSCERQVEDLGRQVRSACAEVDVLVNNAGIGSFGSAATLATTQLRGQMEVNFYGAVYCSTALRPLLLRSNAGYILNVGSLLSQVPLPATGAYAASKCALYGYTRALQRELAGSGLRAGIVLPGPMSTAFHGRSPDDAPACPAFMRLRPDRVASLMERMIRARAKLAYAYRSTLWLMRLKAMVDRSQTPKP